VRHEGDDLPITDLTSKIAHGYAALVAAAFGVESIEPVEFDQNIAEKWLALHKKVQDKLRRENPMTKQPLKASVRDKITKITEKIVAIQTNPNAFTRTPGKGKNKREVAVAVSDSTLLTKDGATIAFTSLEVETQVEVQVTEGVATSATVKWLRRLSCHTDSG
jgi:hypothetical protein